MKGVRYARTGFDSPPVCSDTPQGGRNDGVILEDVVY